MVCYTLGKNKAVIFLDEESKELLREILKVNKKILKLLQKNSLLSDKPSDKNKVVAYVDASYNNVAGIGAYGIVFLIDNVKKTYSGKPNFPFSIVMNSTMCECCAVITAVGIAMSLKIKKIVVNYDCSSVVDILEIPEHNRKPEQKWYCDFIAKARKKIKIKFVKVQAHSDDEYNKEADSLAKSALRKFVGEMQKRKV